MSQLPPFQVLAPHSLPEAAETLARHGPDARLLAGGTDLLPNLKRGQASPGVLVSLRGVRELRGIRTEPVWDDRSGRLGDVRVDAGNGRADSSLTPADSGNGRQRPGDGSGAEDLVIGAGTSLADLASNPAIRQSFPVIAQAAALIATPTLRRMGTVGGNLCLETRCSFYDRPALWREAAGYCMKHAGDICQVAPGGDRCWATMSSDLAPVMVALGASIRLVSAEGERTLAVEDLYRDDGLAHLALAPGEILADLRLPAAEGWQGAYLKLRPRCAIDFPALGVAVALQLSGGECRDARIVLGAVASRPLRVREAEALIVGQRLIAQGPGEDPVHAAAEAAYRVAKPMDNTDMPPAYRRQMVRVYVARALRMAIGQFR